MSELKVEKTLEVGKWRVFIFEKGLTLTKVAIKGLRNRPLYLEEVTPEFFYKISPKMDDGTPMDSPVVVRGLPSVYAKIGHTIFIHPIPAHRWTLELTYAGKKNTRPDLSDAQETA